MSMHVHPIHTVPRVILDAVAQMSSSLPQIQETKGPSSKRGWQHSAKGCIDNPKQHVGRVCLA